MHIPNSGTGDDPREGPRRAPQEPQPQLPSYFIPCCRTTSSPATFVHISEPHIIRDTGNMATVADELLADFDDSGSEHEEAENANAQDDVQQQAAEEEADNAMQLDLDGEGEISKPGADAEAEQEAKARISKMQFSKIKDVRSVAVLLDKLEPVLEVSHARPPALTSFAWIYSV